MNEMRKKIIIKEIIYWKKSKILPDRYCDYLIALYTGGEEVPSRAETKSKNEYLYYIAVLLVMIVPLVLNYFTELASIMQIVILLMAAAALLLLTYFFTKRKFLIQLPLIAAAILLLVATVEVAMIAAPGNNVILFLVLIAHSLLWMYAGKKFSIMYFIVAGALGLAVIGFFIIRIYFMV